MDALKRLKQKRFAFGVRLPGDNDKIESPAPDPGERSESWNECDRIYRVAWSWVQRLARHVDQVNELLPAPWERFELSETFLARDRALVAEIEAEWLAERPDLEKFRKLCAEWEANCMIELKAKLAEMRSVE